MKCSASFSVKGITDVDPAMVIVCFTFPSLPGALLPQEQRRNVTIMRNIAVLFAKSLTFRLLQMPDDLSFYHEYDQFGDIDGVIGHSFHIF